MERRHTESPLTRAFAVHARTLEVLDARGTADELVAGGARSTGSGCSARPNWTWRGRPPGFRSSW
ncbi:FAD-dependent monooxygenase [Streptomyces sp. GESEQ-4]|uniref:FAD-dependent monooxygenase n=1 Tax=Streptomyces sp. GESEQ-4 TaxID=2812655 RepID=UPI0027DE3A01|nr:FAD-dependent monooxygenase [Streptomyces sp. GESEQ-4]